MTMKKHIENAGLPMAMVREALQAAYATTSTLPLAVGMMILTLDRSGKLDISAHIAAKTERERVAARTEAEASIGALTSMSSIMRVQQHVSSSRTVAAGAPPLDADVKEWLAVPGKKVILNLPRARLMLEPAKTWREIYRGLLDEIGWGP